ncbi:LOB domain-containing protein 20 [Linum grandiflorum]
MNTTSDHQQSASTPLTPCGACKFLRRKCVSGCIFAPHFGNDQGAARFAAVHKVFGASNVSKLLLHIPVNRRNEAVVTISYEAQARLSDPVLGCVSTILTLQQQACLINLICIPLPIFLSFFYLFCFGVNFSCRHFDWLPCCMHYTFWYNFFFQR